ncbi:MAG TPA: hypothetical protein VJC09_03400 [Candidatus Saccharimonadales bacterium]|nr:hypothetical protein [Candidatus Saccharimonadales bacterium]
MKRKPEQGLHTLADEVQDDARVSKRDRNAFFVAGIALESVMGVVKLAGVDLHPITFGAAAFMTFMPAGMCEISRRLSIHRSADFREGARGIVELDMLIRPEWEQTLQEPRNTE